MPIETNVLRRLAATALLLLAACTLFVTPAWSQEYEEVGEPDFDTLTIQQVPEDVMASVRQQAPSVVFTSAQRYWEDDEQVFRVSGRLYREVWHVYVTRQGRHLKTETDVMDDD